MSRLVVVSNRLPDSSNGTNSGGLAVAISDLFRSLSLSAMTSSTLIRQKLTTVVFAGHQSVFSHRPGGRVVC